MFIVAINLLFYYNGWQLFSVLLGKMPLTKKAHEKSLTSIEQSLMAGPNCQAGLGEKMVQQRFWARHGFYRKGG
jgi:hypothetical protein